MASASESSSAVLDLNDVDYEEGASTGGTDDMSLTPLIMEHGYDIAIKVDAPMKQLSTLETFVTYRVRCACARWANIPPYVRRRYNHFKVLYKRLAAAYPLFAVPPLPPLHSARQQLDRYSPSFVAVRTLALNAYLDSIAKHPILTHSEDFRLFCTTPDDEFDKVFKSENSAMNLWGLSSALYGSSDPKPTSEPRVRDPEWSCACDYLSALQQRLTTLCALTSKLYKHSTALGNLYLNMRTASAALGRHGYGVCWGAGRAGGAWRGAGTASARARLPLLAAHAALHVHKIRQRHHAPGELGGLPAAEEALRAELSVWRPRARAHVREVLLDVAERHTQALTQILFGWEHALRISTDADIGELFKTVSRTAVQNLSPSKCKGDTPSVTENNIEDLETYTDSDSLEKLVNDEEKDTNLHYGEVFDRSSEGSDVIGQNIDRIEKNSDRHAENNLRIGENNLRIDENNLRIGENSDRNGDYVRIEEDPIRIEENITNGESSDRNGENSDRSGENNNRNGENIVRIGENSDSNKQDSEKIVETEKEIEDVLDPLRGFSDVDISS